MPKQKKPNRHCVLFSVTADKDPQSPLNSLNPLDSLLIGYRRQGLEM